MPAKSVLVLKSVLPAALRRLLPNVLFVATTRWSMVSGLLVASGRVLSSLLVLENVVPALPLASG